MNDCSRSEIRWLSSFVRLATVLSSLRWLFTSRLNTWTDFCCCETALREFQTQYLTLFSWAAFLKAILSMRLQSRASYSPQNLMNSMTTSPLLRSSARRKPSSKTASTVASLPSKVRRESAWSKGGTTQACRPCSGASSICSECSVGT